MKIFKKLILKSGFIITAINLILISSSNSLAKSNITNIRDPFKFNDKVTQEVIIDPDINNYRVIGSGKTGNGISFIMLQNGQKNKIVTENDPEWKFYN